MKVCDHRLILLAVCCLCSKYSLTVTDDLLYCLLLSFQLLLALSKSSSELQLIGSRSVQFAIAFASISRSNACRGEFSKLEAYLGSDFSVASLPQSSSAEGLSVSLSLRQWSARGRRGWLGSTRSISFLRRSLSGTGICIIPVGDLGSSTVVVASVG